jgi:hypothetical protein
VAAHLGGVAIAALEVFMGEHGAHLVGLFLHARCQHAMGRVVHVEPVHHLADEAAGARAEGAELAGTPALRNHEAPR